MLGRRIPWGIAAAIPALVGASSALAQFTGPPNTNRISRIVDQSSVKLSDAIQVAERECNGKAVSARLAGSALRRDARTSRTETSATRTDRLSTTVTPVEPAPVDNTKARSAGTEDRLVVNDEQLKADQEGQRASRETKESVAIQTESTPATAAPSHDGSLDGAHYVIVCLVGDKLMSVDVDCQTGKVLGSHEASTYGERRPMALNTSARPVTPMATRIYKASDVIGTKVENADGKDLGKIQDLAIDPDRSRIAYAVLSRGGFIGVNEKLFAIPWKSLDLSREHHYVLNVPKDELKNAPGFDKHSWPNMADMRWGTGVHTFYGQRPYWDDQEDFDRDSRLTGIEDENE